MKTKIRLKKKILKTLGLRVKYYRKLKGVSQETLAFMVGVDRTYIGAIEQGLRSPSIYCLFTLANELGITLGELTNITLDDLC